MERKRQWEIASTGLDEYLQTIGGDPFNGQSSVGLRVPASTRGTGRYLFLLASFSVAEGACVRIRGYRQLATIGYAQVSGEAPNARNQVVEQEIQSPFWRFPDGNISWHLRRLGPPNAQSIPRTLDAGPIDCESFKYLWADAPCLLYGPGMGGTRPTGNVYTNVSKYVPPNAGKPYGDGVDKLGTFYDLRTQWRTHGAWDSLDIPVRGPDTIAFFASVRQSNPSVRTALTPPGTFYAGGLSVEEQFLLNFPSAIYWRVGGALRVEEG